MFSYCSLKFCAQRDTSSPWWCWIQAQACLILSTFLLIQWNHQTHQEEWIPVACSAYQIQTLSASLLFCDTIRPALSRTFPMLSMPHPCMCLTVWLPLETSLAYPPLCYHLHLFLLWTERGLRLSQGQIISMIWFASHVCASSSLPHSMFLLNQHFATGRPFTKGSQKQQNI